MGDKYYMFLETFRDDIEEWGLITDEVETITNMIYDHDLNFNNADPTSHMRCWSWDEIEHFVEVYLNAS